MAEIQRSPELYGFGDCSESREAWASVAKQLQRSIKFILQRKHTFRELTCFRAAYAAGYLGEMCNAYMEALKQAEWAARPK